MMSTGLRSGEPRSNEQREPMIAEELGFATDHVRQTNTVLRRLASGIAGLDRGMSGVAQPF